MKYKIKHIIIFFSCMAALFLYACNEDWNDHYDRSDALPDENLYELIQSDENLSRFLEMVHIAGYDSVLTSSQTYTVWAPVNAALKDVDLTDEEEVTRIVRNHIGRFNVSSATVIGKLIRMINKKIYTFESDGSLTFGGSLVIEHDRLAKNGQLHTLDEMIPYFYNVYEYMQVMENTSYIGDFVASFDTLTYEISGNDTIYSEYNPLFERYYGLGTINREDSVYTMLVPTNRAWEEAYERISPYFKVYNSNREYADSVQKTQTSLAIINDLIFRGEITNPSAHDTLLTTSGSVIRNVEELFAGSNPVTASNGLIYLTDEIRYDNTETWQKKIEVECEDVRGRVLGQLTSITTMTVDPSGLFTDVSGQRYIEVTPTSVSTQPSVSFEIPNVLSGKYNIYVEFIPEIIKGESFKSDSTRVLFSLKYMNAGGSSVETFLRNDNFVTSGTQKVKILAVSEFEFPVSNYYDDLWWLIEGNSYEDYILTTILTITTQVTQQEVNRGTFKRRFLADRIIFEPIRNE